MARSRSTESFEAQVLPHRPFVAMKLRCLGMFKDAIDDGINDVFALAWKKWPEYNPRWQVTTWLGQLAWSVYGHWRARGTTGKAKWHQEVVSLTDEQCPEGEHEHADPASEFVDELCERDWRGTVLRQLWRLDERQMEVMLTRLECETDAEVARALGISRQAVGEARRQAERKLQKLVEAA